MPHCVTYAAGRSFSLQKAAGCGKVGGMTVRRLCLLCSALVLAACSQPMNFSITSDPTGAEVTVNGKPVGVTPLVTRVKQDKSLAIVAFKPGYRVASKTVPTKTNWWRTLLWTKHDPKAQYLEESSAHLHLTPVVSSAAYKPSVLPAYAPGAKLPQRAATPSAAPALRPLPPL